MSAHRRASQPLVSVIVPVFNQRRFLPETVACLAAQSHPSMETIFINDGSTDGSVSFLDELCVDSVRVIHQENCGPSAARNAGLRAARGDFIQFLDDDDQLAPDSSTTRIQIEKQTGNQSQPAPSSTTYKSQKIDQIIAACDLSQYKTSVKTSVT